MRLQYFIPVLILLLSSILLSACDSAGAFTSTSQMGITPKDTSAGTLLVTIGITEDQDAADSKSMLTLQFRSDVVAEDNFVRFAHQEVVTCNGVTLKLGDAPTYSVIVAQGGYTCSYTGYTQGIGHLAPVTMIAIAARSRLSPQPPSVNSAGYTINYAPDASERACSITADATDGANNVIPGSASSSALGVYHGPATTSLTGDRNDPLATNVFLDTAQSLWHDECDLSIDGQRRGDLGSLKEKSHGTAICRELSAMQYCGRGWISFLSSLWGYDEWESQLNHSTSG